MKKISGGALIVARERFADLYWVGTEQYSKKGVVKRHVLLGYTLEQMITLRDVLNRLLPEDGEPSPILKCAGDQKSKADAAPRK